MPALAVAATSEAAADAAERMARLGGSAVDAALAAALVAMVNEVGVVSISSGGFVTVQPSDGPAYTVDGWMDMPGRSLPGAEPSDSTWDVSTAYGGGLDVTIGPGSVAVHGSLAAFGEAHRRDGRLPWHEIVAPALEVARDGFRLTSATRYYLDFTHEDIFGWDRASREALSGPDGGVTTGPVVVPDLAASLELIAAEGPRVLHDGELADLISRDVLGRGGLLGPEDLAAYRPVVRPALLTRAGPWALATTPPPSVGGVCVAAMLRLLLEGEGGWDPADDDRLVRVQRAVLGHRLDVLDVASDLQQAARELLDLVDRDPISVLESGSTAHVSATDATGCACAVTVSSGYGSGMIAAGTGIWLNNCLGEQELNPSGLYAATPGTRLLSNMAPTVARHDDGSTLAIGSPGADRITTAIVQVLGGFLGGLSLQEAVDRQRLHVHRAGRPEETVRREADPNMYFGGVGATLVKADGRLVAAADTRRAGAVRIVEGAP